MSGNYGYDSKQPDAEEVTCNITGLGEFTRIEQLYITSEFSRHHKNHMDSK